jgi:hypothetical protein
VDCYEENIQVGPSPPTPFWVAGAVTFSFSELRRQVAGAKIFVDCYEDGIIELHQVLPRCFGSRMQLNFLFGVAGAGCEESVTDSHRVCFSTRVTRMDNFLELG